jgi:hypothetical protein
VCTHATQVFVLCIFTLERYVVFINMNSLTECVDAFLFQVVEQNVLHASIGIKGSGYESAHAHRHTDTHGTGVDNKDTLMHQAFVKLKRKT